jgi:hypothetical protein
MLADTAGGSNVTTSGLVMGIMSVASSALNVTFSDVVSLTKNVAVPFVPVTGELDVT